MNYKVGDVVTFLGYAEDVAESDRLFNVGETLRIDQVEEDGSYIAVSQDDQDQSRGGTVLESEISPKEPKSKSKSKSKSKAKAKGTAKSGEESPVQAKQDGVKASKTPKALNVVEVPSEGEESDFEPIEITQEIQDQVSAHNNDALAAAKALIARGDQVSFTLGGVLHAVHSGNLHRTKGYSGRRSFAIFVEEALGLKYRKAMALMQTYAVWTRMGLNSEAVARIGWSKAALIASAAGRVGTVEEVQSLIHVAEEQSISTLKDRITQSYGTVRTGERKISFAFRADNAEAQIVRDALDAARSQLNTDSLGALFSFICGEWASLTEGLELTEEQELKRLSQRYGKVFVATDRRYVDETAAAAENEQESEIAEAA